MKLQHDTHYLTRSLDVRYVIEDKVLKNFWSKHSLYNPNNIDNTKEVSECGTTYYFYTRDNDIILNSALCIQREKEDFILLQNFEFVNYYANELISTVIRSNDSFAFLSDKNSKQGCIRVKKYNLDINEFPVIAVFYDKNKRIRNKLNNLYGCLKWLDTQHSNSKI